MSSRFSTADAAWLHMDRPTNLMVINSVLLFDAPVDWQRVKQLTQERMVDAYPRFRQRPVESRLPLRPPKWVDDPDFELEHHMHHLALPEPGDIATLQELVSDLMTMPLDRNRPLWHMYMIDGLGDGGAMISRMHHCIADGIALARVMLSLTDSNPDAGIAPLAPEDERRAQPGLITDAAQSALEVVGGVRRVGAATVRQGIDLARSPSHAAKLAGAIGRDAGTAVRLLLTPADAATALKGDPGISRRVAWSEPLSLPEVKHIAHSHKATVNDVLLAAVSGALRHYLQERGGPVTEVQAMVPFNLRPLDKPVPRKLGNKFGLVFLPLPVGTSGSFRRLTEVHRRMEEIKNGRDGPVSYGLLSITGLTPEPLERRIIDVFTAKTTAVMTNVPGPREPVYLAGTRVRSAIVWAPTSGHMGMSVSIFSYCGEVTVGLMTDAALVGDPDQIVNKLHRELRSLASLKRAPRRRREKATTTSVKE
jgi:diacylglycerol O-acyltransferase / wax synthase